MKFTRGIFDVIAAIALLVSTTSFFILAPLALLGCVAPTDDLYINTDTTLCKGTFSLTDAGAQGIIIINQSNIVLDCDGAAFIGDNTGVAFLIKDVDNVTIKGCTVKNYTNAFKVDNSNVTLTNNTVCHNDVPFNVLSGNANIFANRFCVTIISPADNARHFSGTNPLFIFNVSDFFSRTDCYVYHDEVRKGGTTVTAENQYAPIRTLFYTNLVYQNVFWNVRCSDGNNTGESEVRRMIIVSDYQFPSLPTTTPTPTPEPTEEPTPTIIATITPTPTPTPIPSPTSIIVGPSVQAPETDINGKESMNFIQQISYSITGKPINIDEKCGIFFVIPIICAYCWVLLLISVLVLLYIVRKFSLNPVYLLSSLFVPLIVAFLIDCGLSTTLTITFAVILGALFVKNTSKSNKK